MFFSSTPNFLYPDFKTPGKYKLSKNLFRRVRTRDSFNAIYASSRQYTITPGETPDSIAFKEYGDSNYYWAILLLNNILDTQTQWPLSNDELDNYIEKTYGDLADKPRHWETPEVRDGANNIVIDSGIIVELFQNTTEQNQSNYNPKIRDFNGGNVIAFEIINAGTGYSTGDSIPTIGVGNGFEIDITEVSVSTGSVTNANISNSVGQSGVGYSANDLVTVGGGDKNCILKITDASSLEKNWEYVYEYAENVTRTLTADDLVKVTNREYENNFNELKREIYLPTFSSIPIMESEIQSLLEYDTKYKITPEGYRLPEV